MVLVDPPTRLRYGRTTFYLNLLIYLGYLVSLTMYVATVENVITTQYVDEKHGCPIYLNETELKNNTLIEFYIKVSA